MDCLMHYMKKLAMWQKKELLRAQELEEYERCSEV